MKYFKSIILLFTLSVFVIGACGNKSGDEQNLTNETNKQQVDQTASVESNRDGVLKPAIWI